MPQLTITVHERPYQVVCEEGQEAHVEKLAAYIDQRVRELASKSGVPGPSGQITEARLLVMAALLIADELGETYDEIEALRQAPPRMVPDPASLKAADEARSAASAARVQLAEAEAAARAAMGRVSEAEAARAAAEAEAARRRDALGALEQRVASLEHALREADAERESLAATLSSLSAQTASVRAGDDALAAGLEGLAQQVETMAARVERSAAR